MSTTGSLLSLASSGTSYANLVGSASPKPNSKSSSAAAPAQLTPQQQAQVDELRRADQQVRSAALLQTSVGGSVVTTGPQYSYTTGPDGRRYAVSGSVGFDTAKVLKPQGNIDKGELLQRAALAPPNPSPYDHQVAAVGAGLEADGRSDLLSQKLAQAQAQSAADIAATSDRSAQQLLQKAYGSVNSASPVTPSVSQYA
jgi:hypothetical protein